jgi:nitrogen regulatory protein PII
MIPDNLVEDTVDAIISAAATGIGDGKSFSRALTK